MLTLSVFSLIPSGITSVKTVFFLSSSFSFIKSVYSLSSSFPVSGFGITSTCSLFPSTVFLRVSLPFCGYLTSTMQLSLACPSSHVKVTSFSYLLLSTASTTFPLYCTLYLSLLLKSPKITFTH